MLNKRPNEKYLGTNFRLLSNQALIREYGTEIIPHAYPIRVQGSYLDASHATVYDPEECICSDFCTATGQGWYAVARQVEGEAWTCL
jgi:hypothetical protein